MGSEMWGGIVDVCRWVCREGILRGGGYVHSTFLRHHVQYRVSQKGALIEMAITPLKSLRNNGKGLGVLEN